MRETVASQLSLAEPQLRDANARIEVSRMSELLLPRPLVRLLFEGGSYIVQRARFNCGYYSRAATIRGAATIRVNTVYTQTLSVEDSSNSSLRHIYTHEP